MADLVGDRLSHALAARARAVREHPGRLVEVVVRAGDVERVDVRHAAAAAGVEDRAARRDVHGHAVLGVRGGVPSQLVGSGLARGDVDVEGRVVLGDHLPGVLDLGELGAAEAGVDAVVDRVGRDVDRAAVALVPGGAADLVPAEVEVDRARGARTRVQRERLVEWFESHGRPGGGRLGDVGACLLLRLRCRLVDVEGETAAVGPQRGHVGAGLLGEPVRRHLVGAAECAAVDGRRGEGARHRQGALEEGVVAAEHLPLCEGQSTGGHHRDRHGDRQRPLRAARELWHEPSSMRSTPRR